MMYRKEYGGWEPKHCDEEHPHSLAGAHNNDPFKKLRRDKKRLNGLLGIKEENWEREN